MTTLVTKFSNNQLYADVAKLSTLYREATERYKTTLEVLIDLTMDRSQNSLKVLNPSKQAVAKTAGNFLMGQVTPLLAK